MREKEKEHIGEKVKWYDTISEIPEVNGCVISNELLDNFAVHEVVMDEYLQEVFVDYDNGFTEVMRPAPEPLKNYLEELGVDLPRGYRTEINLEATEWVGEIANALKAGYLLTIDYGHLANELYNAERCEGTLVCYNKHKINFQPYQDIGMQDITAHVNFSALVHSGAKKGLDITGYTNQENFLVSLGIKEQLIKQLLHGNDDPYEDLTGNIPL